MQCQFSPKPQFPSNNGMNATDCNKQLPSTISHSPSKHRQCHQNRKMNVWKYWFNVLSIVSLNFFVADSKPSFGIIVRSGEKRRSSAIQPQRVWWKEKKANNKESRARARSKHFFYFSQFLRFHISGFFFALLLYDRRFCSNLTKIEFYALNSGVWIWKGMRGKNKKKNSKNDENKLSFPRDIISQTIDINWALSSTLEEGREITPFRK